jgi:hypothetical protein
MAGDAADDLVDAVKLGPLRRKITEYSDKADNAVSAVKNAWENSPAKQAYRKYVGGGIPTKITYPSKSETEAKKAAPRKRVATKK